MVTSEQVAQLAGVSRATVSRALSGSARVSEEARERVHAAITTLGYEPDMVAQSLVRQRSHVLAVSLFPADNEAPLSYLGQTSQYFYLKVLQYIESEAIAQGYDLLLPSRPRGKPADHIVRALQVRRAAGAIVFYATDAPIQALIHSAIPTVFIDRISQGSHATYVKSDNMDGAMQATEHLLSLGHQRIVFMTGSTSDFAGLDRLLGGQQALVRAGVTPDSTLIRQTGWDIDEAYQAANTLLTERRDFTAIVAGSDLMAMGILRALAEHGLRVPDDISLVGFDDVELSQYTIPPLTTVRQDHAAMGRGAVQRAIAILEGDREVAPLILPTKLVVRKSTARAAKDL